MPFTYNVVSGASADRLEKLIEERLIPGADKSVIDRRIWRDLPGTTDLQPRRTSSPPSNRARHQTRRALDRLPRRTNQHTAGQYAECRNNFRIAPDGRSLIFGPQQAAVFERGKIGRYPGSLIGRQINQRAIR